MSETLPPVVGKLVGDTSHFQSAFSQAHSHVSGATTGIVADLGRVEQSVGAMEQGMGRAAGSGVGHAAALSGAFSGVGTHALAVLGEITGVGLAVGGAGVFAISSANQFKDFGLEVGKLTRMTGGSAEEMSRWDFAARDVAVSADQLGTGFKFLSKDIAGTSKSGADALLNLGVATKDAAGNARPMADVMLDVAEKFAAMDEPAEKNALAMQVFGRSGMDLIPILNKGRDGLSELMGQADKFGMVMDASGVQKSREAAKAQRELGMAWDGLQMTIGQYVLPVLTSAAKWLTERIQPAIAGMKPALQWLQDAWGDVAAAFSNTGFSGGLDMLGKKLSELWGKAQPMLSELWGKVQPVLADWMGKVGNWIGSVAVPWLGDRAKALGASLIQWVKDSWPGWVAQAKIWLGQVGEWILHTALPWIGQQAGQLKDSFLRWLADAIRALPGQLGQFAGKLMGWIGDQATQMPPRLAKLAGHMVRWIVDAAREAPGKLADYASRLKDFLLDLPGKIKDWIGDAASWLLQAGKDALAGLWNGMRDAIPGLLSNIAGLPGKIIDGFRHGFDSHSPSRLMMPVGHDIAAGVLVGMDQGFDGDAIGSRVAAWASGARSGQADIAHPAGTYDQRKARLDAVEAAHPREVHHHWDFAGATVLNHEQLMDYVAEGLRRREGAIA